MRLLEFGPLRASAIAMALLALSCGTTAESAITLESVTPAEGSARGGDTVTIEGSGFGSAPKVRFGDVEAEVVSATATSIEVRTPRRLAGPVPVEVESAGARARLDDGFTFAPLPLAFADIAWTAMAPFTANGGHCIAADADNDGDLDILQAAHAEGVYLHPNDGKGNLGEPTQIDSGDPATDVGRIEFADFDGDGAPDLFLAATQKTPPRILSGNGQGDFTLFAAALPEVVGDRQTAAVADIDSDGDLDLVTTGTAAAADLPAAVTVFLNEGGVFSDETQVVLPGDAFDAPGVAAADVDSDGDLDLLFSGDKSPCRLYLNDGLGTFGRAAPDALPHDEAPAAGIPAFGDLDDDGDLDVYLPTAAQDRVWLNDGTGHFIDLTESWLSAEKGNGQSAQLIDLDFDGHLDVLVLDRPGALRLYRNDGKGRFFDYTADLAGNLPAIPAAGVAAGDLDNDGDADLFLSRDEWARPALFTNWSPRPPFDKDGDGTPDGADSCPAAPNADQQNRDSHHFFCEATSICKAETGCDLVARGPSAWLLCRDKPLAWPAAADFCAARGARLVVIDDAAENDWLASLGVPDAWIGYSDTMTEGSFAWVEGGGSFTQWAMGEPNDSGGNEDCAVLLANGEWNDAPCDAPRAFLCEDARAKAPDPGDACDGCPSHYEPGSAPVLGDAGTCDQGMGGGSP